VPLLPELLEPALVPELRPQALKTAVQEAALPPEQVLPVLAAQVPKQQPALQPQEP